MENQLIKYKLSAPHSEVRKILNYIQSGDALDLGCGRGRNSIFLQNKGFNVTAFDHNQSSINTLNTIIESEKLTNIQTAVYDIQQANLEKTYDLIFSTVVFQFLQTDSIEYVVKNIQEHTRKEGYNLIVAPISTDAMPCPIDFPFTFKENELKHYYKDWNICEYKEELGTFHKKDTSGQYYKAKFATLIAQKQ